MFKRGGLISRSLHAPRGVNIHGESKNIGIGPAAVKIKRKFSWASSRVRGAVSESALTHRPLVLKEGFLYKPGFLRIRGRKRRWCVLRTYNQTEASIDLYTDETKTRYKGSVTLDREVSPLLVVKNYDPKKKTAKNCFLSIKVAKHSYQFAADSFKELREWTALIRQAIDNGHIYSGKVTEPQCIEEGTVNVKFHINCIALMCPITEAPIKKWRLDHITSFGQCGGILTFECCSTCSDSSTARCCINIVQEKPSTILNLMEKAIRNNPNTGEIHYERSILGDIYHCDHDCCQTQRLLPAFSDPNIFRSSTASPHKSITVPVDVHADTLGSNDSGLPGTPKQADALSINSNIPSPTQQNLGREKDSPYRSAKQQSQGAYKFRSMSTSEVGLPLPNTSDIMMQYTRRQSDENQRTSSSNNYYGDGEATRRRLVYAAVRPNSGRKSGSIEEDSVTYSTVSVTSPTDTYDYPGERRNLVNGRMLAVDENDGIYDIPESEPNRPAYWDIGGDSAFSPPGTPFREGNHKSSAQSTFSIYEPGSDVREREEDFEELPPVPKHKNKGRPAVKELVKLNSTGSSMKTRQRLHSTGDVLESRPLKDSRLCGRMGSMDNLDQAGRNRSRSLANPLADTTSENLEFLNKLHEEDEMLTRVLAASRRERNEEVVDESRIYLSPTSRWAVDRRTSVSPISSRNVDKFLTKKASDTVKGYAYKIQIPLSNTEYDVPRRAAPAPDLSNLRSDAPPKPLRHVND